MFLTLSTTVVPRFTAFCADKFDYPHTGLQNKCEFYLQFFLDYPHKEIFNENSLQFSKFSHFGGKTNWYFPFIYFLWGQICQKNSSIRTKLAGKDFFHIKFPRLTALRFTALRLSAQIWQVPTCAVNRGSTVYVLCWNSFHLELFFTFL